jgi:hypothetical protein
MSATRYGVPKDVPGPYGPAQCRDGEYVMHSDYLAACRDAVAMAREVTTIESWRIWRSVYPTCDGYWWYRGPANLGLVKVNMIDGRPYSPDNELLDTVTGEWAGPVLEAIDDLGILGQAAQRVIAAYGEEEHGRQ